MTTQNRLRSRPEPRSAPRVLRSSERRFLALVFDTLAVSTGVLLSLWTWSLTAGFVFSIEFVVDRAWWLLAIPLWLLVLAPTREHAALFDLARTFEGIVKAAALLAIVYLIVFFASGRYALPRLVSLYVVWNCSVLVLAGRVLLLYLLTRAPLARRALIVGSAETIAPTLTLLSHAGFMDVEIVGTSIGAAEHVDEQALALGATDILVALGREVDEHLVQQLLQCRESGIQISSMAGLYERTLRRVPVRHLGPSLVLTSFLSGVPAGEASPLAKRLLDLTAGSALLVVGVVILPLVALAVVIESGFPVFYRQVRLGRAGHPFTLLKLRTMRADAELRGVQWSSPDDPRTTCVGRLLRRTRLDELPNVLAVLRGELSMVGPRPERPEFVEMLDRSIPLYRARLAVAPGLTGWAQVNHKYGDSVEDALTKLEYDLYYIKHQSLWLDLVILGRTVFTMLRLKGQ